MSEKETHVFQAEITQLMNLIINTFYSNKDIFLRELVSNSSDAIDKYNHECIINKPEETHPNRIDFIPDKEKKQLFIIDTGIGMDKQDLITNLGTIATSGTKAFMEKVKDSNLIGQFGVGFYSAFLVADKVSVISRKGDSIWKWESNAGGEFTIEELADGKIHEDYELKQGTAIQLFLKDDKYTNIETLKSIVKEHSQYINYPIYVLTSREETKEIEIDGAAEAACCRDSNEESNEESKEDSKEDSKEESKEEPNEDGADNEDGVIVEDVNEEEEEAAEKKKKTKTITETIKEFVLINEHKPIWLKPTNEITEEEYHGFYKSLTNDHAKPYCYKHLQGEGQIEYKGVIYLPKNVKNNVFERGVKQNNIKLYVRKIFVSDNSAVLCPEWLHFVSGMVDTDDLPLNVSREMLQENKVIKVLKKTIVKKSIDMLKTAMQDMDNYKNIYNTYQKNIKLGVYEESGDRERIADLLMFYSLNSPDKMITFDDYITTTNDNQKTIYYISGDDLDILKTSPFLDRFKKRNIDVLYMTDPVDEYMFHRMSLYKEYNFVCITKGDVELPDTTEEEKELVKKQQEEYKQLCDYIKKVYSKDFNDVKITNKINDLPCIVSSPEHGYSANMERIIKAQTLGQKEGAYMLNKRILEINPLHPIIKKVKDIKDINDNGAGANEAACCRDEHKSSRDLLDLVINSALLYSGYQITKPVDFSRRVLNVVMAGLDITEDGDDNDAVEEGTATDEAIETIDVTAVD